jgi:hypothetical protein
LISDVEMLLRKEGGWNCEPLWRDTPSHGLPHHGIFVPSNSVLSRRGIAGERVTNGRDPGRGDIIARERMKRIINHASHSDFLRIFKVGVYLPLATREPDPVLSQSPSIVELPYVW